MTDKKPGPKPVSRAPAPLTPLRGCSAPPDRPPKPSATPPNWENWRLLESAAPWEIAALSLNIEPTSVNPHEYGYERDPFPDDATFARFQSIERAIQQRFVAYNNKLVNIAEFVAWAVSKNLDMPPVLHAMGAASFVEPKPKADASTAINNDAVDMAAWRAVALESWSKITAQHGPKPTARNVLSWLKKNGPQDVVAKDQPDWDALRWFDSYGNPQTTTLKSLSNCLSEWRKVGKIPT